MQWFRLYHEWAHDPKIQMLDYATQRHFIMLLCMHSEGLVTETTEDEEVAFYLRVTVTEAVTLREALRVRFLEKNSWVLKAWKERQRESDDAAARVRKYRENKKKLEKRNSNVTVTALTEQNRTDKNKIPPSGPPVGDEPAKARRIPDDWEPGDDGEAYAAERGFSAADTEDMAENFREHWSNKSGKAGLKLDWGKTWQTWVRNQQKFDDSRNGTVRGKRKELAPWSTL